MLVPTKNVHFQLFEIGYVRTFKFQSNCALFLNFLKTWSMVNLFFKYLKVLRYLITIDWLLGIDWYGGFRFSILENCEN